MLVTKAVTDPIVKQGNPSESPPIQKGVESGGGSWAREMELEDLSKGKERSCGEGNSRGWYAEEGTATGGNYRGEKSWTSLFANNRNGDCGLKLEKVTTEEDEVLVTVEEMETEKEYWKHSLFGFILGQEIPINAMVNFLRGRWRGLPLPKVVKVEKGFIFRFESKEAMEAVSRRGIQFFYSKPLILQPWHGDGDGDGENYDTITSVLVWIQLPRLPIGLWGASTLSKIASKIGEPVHTDEMTAQRLRLDYARVLVKVEMGSELPREIKIRMAGKEGMH